MCAQESRVATSCSPLPVDVGCRPRGAALGGEFGGHLRSLSSRAPPSETPRPHRIIGGGTRSPGDPCHSVVVKDSYGYLACLTNFIISFSGNEANLSSCRNCCPFREYLEAQQSQYDSDLNGAIFWKPWQQLTGRRPITSSTVKSRFRLSHRFHPPTATSRRCKRTLRAAVERR